MGAGFSGGICGVTGVSWSDEVDGTAGDEAGAAACQTPGAGGLTASSLERAAGLSPEPVSEPEPEPEPGADSGGGGGGGGVGDELGAAGVFESCATAAELGRGGGGRPGPDAGPDCEGCDVPGNVGGGGSAGPGEGVETDGAAGGGGSADPAEGAPALGAA
jgi:hypothetical protein